MDTNDKCSCEMCNMRDISDKTYECYICLHLDLEVNDIPRSKMDLSTLKYDAFIDENTREISIKKHNTDNTDNTDNKEVIASISIAEEKAPPRAIFKDDKSKLKNDEELLLVRIALMKQLETDLNDITRVPLTCPRHEVISQQEL